MSCHKLKPYHVNYTYFHETLQHNSYIDFLLVSSAISKDVCHFEAFDLADNLSDHNPIMITLTTNDLTPDRAADKPTNPISATQKYLRWDRANISEYYECTRIQLEPVYNFLMSEINKLDCNDSQCPHCYYDYCKCKTTCFDSNYDTTGFLNVNAVEFHPTTRPKAISLIEYVYDKVIECLSLASSINVPAKKSNYYKFWWDQHLSDLKQESIATHKEWINARRPHCGIIFENKTKAKANYKHYLKHRQATESENFSNSLHDALLVKDQGRFWKCFNSKFGNKNKPPSVIDGVCDEKLVSDNFAKYFANICDYGSALKNKEFIDKFNCRLKRYRGDLYDYNEDVNVYGVDSAINELKLGKAAGNDEVSAEHLKYCHPILTSMLCALFKLMLRFEYIPDAFGVGLTIPIPKANGNVKPVTCDDFRGITLSPIISKVFEKCLLQSLNQYLLTSVRQFGFKKNTSCAHAIFVVRKTVEYFTQNDSTVNMCAIDLCKAYDKVNNHALFLKLMDRNIPRKILLTLHCWYSKVYVVVKWKMSLSHAVKLNAGVRQGGILSPYLFAVFVNNVLEKLSKCKLGCHVKSICCNALMYADDLLLLSISMTDLRAMVNICNDEFDELDLKINFKKSCGLRIGKHHNRSVSPIIIDNQIMHWKQEMHYLGVVLKSAKTFNISVQNLRQNFFRALNGIIGKIGTKASACVTLSLVQSFCLPILMYGIEALEINTKLMKSLDNAYCAIFSKLFGSYDQNVIQHCQFYSYWLPLNLLIDERKLNFYYKLLTVKNDAVNFLFAKYEGDKVSELLARYNMTQLSGKTRHKSCIWKIFEDFLCTT